MPISADAGGLKWPPKLDMLKAEGFRAMYRLDYRTAEEKFLAMTEEMPLHPSGYVFLASLYWWQYSNDFENPDAALEAKFYEAARKGIALAKAWKAGGGRSIEADFWLGGAYGLIGRLHASQFEWIRAYLNGKRGYNYLRSVAERDPEYYDAFLGVGEFEYLASRLPGVIRIPALLFVRGDREGGLKACTLAAEKGTFGATEAKLFLVAVYNEHEHDYASALRWVDSLLRDDPENLLFRMMRGAVLFYKGDYASSEKEIGEVVQTFEGAPGDPLRTLLSTGYYHLGTLALVQKRYDDAVAWYTRGVEEKEYPKKGWVTNCRLRRGQTHDLAGRRQEALADYAAVLGRPNFWDTRKFARRHQYRPASMADVLGQLFGEHAVQFEKGGAPPAPNSH